MSSNQQFDFWYAVNNTELIAVPENRLETFGDTVVNYYLVCELMDSVDRVCIREGHIKALKPEIITPQSLGQMNLDDFGPDAQQYADWLEAHGGDLKILQYGFRIQKQEIRKYIVTDRLNNVLDRVKSEVAALDDPLSAVLVGVDSPWEVCLLKLMVELVQRSAQGNIQDIRKQADGMRKQLLDTIEEGFLEASRNPARINVLADLLKRSGLWERYEDRFFALVKVSGGEH